MPASSIKLLNKQDSLLLIIDIQEKLLPYIHNQEEVVTQTKNIINLANELKVSIILSEQYPKGLGNTVPELKNCLDKFDYISKTHFSCCADVNFKDTLHKLNKKQIVIAGIETHVCVFQTAVALALQGFEIFVLVNAVGSRFKIDHKYGLKRMQQFNIQLVTFEMVFFEWIHDSASQEFKQLSKIFLKGGKNEH